MADESVRIELPAIRSAINKRARRLAAAQESRLREAITDAVQAARKAGATEQELLDLVNGWESPGGLRFLAGAGRAGHFRPVVALVSSH